MSPADASGPGLSNLWNGLKDGGGFGHGYAYDKRKSVRHGKRAKAWRTFFFILFWIFILTSAAYLARQVTEASGFKASEQKFRRTTERQAAVVH